MYVPESYLAAIIMVAISSFGAVCNGVVVVSSMRLPKMDNPFGRISGNLAMLEGMSLALYLFYYTPMVFFNIHVLQTWSRYFGAFLIGSSQFVLYAHFLMSLNRFSAIFFPFHYTKIFSLANTRIFIIVIWSAAIIPTIFIYVIGSCRFMYFSDYWRFGFGPTDECPEAPFPTNVQCFSVWIILIMLLDFTAIYRVRMYNKGMTGGGVYSCWTTKRKSEEIKLLKQ
ncbi:hypothetical protein GCK32_002923, partial [Trichostrongylus colubriformis]